MSTTPLTRSLDSESLGNQEIERLFQQPGTDILVVPRPKTFAQIETSSLRIADVRSNVSLRHATEEVAQLAGEVGLADPLVLHDIVTSLNAFGEVFKRSTLELRIEYTKKQSCPKFHCDNVFARLIVNYLGPTTEYVYLDRADELHTAPHYAWVFLKGGKHPTFQHNVHHRSPEMNGNEARLCAIVNFAEWVGRP